MSCSCTRCLTPEAGLHRAQPLLQSLELGTRQTPTGYRAIKSQRSMATASTDGEDARASSQPPAAVVQQLQQQPPAQVMQQPAPMLQQAPRARKRSATMAAAEAVAAEAPATKRSKPTARWAFLGEPCAPAWSCHVCAFHPERNCSNSVCFNASCSWVEAVGWLLLTNCILSSDASCTAYPVHA